MTYCFATTPISLHCARRCARNFNIAFKSTRGKNTCIDDLSPFQFGSVSFCCTIEGKSIQDTIHSAENVDHVEIAPLFLHDAHHLITDAWIVLFPYGIDPESCRFTALENAWYSDHRRLLVDAKSLTDLDDSIPSNLAVYSFSGKYNHRVTHLSCLASFVLQPLVV